MSAEESSRTQSQQVPIAEPLVEVRRGGITESRHRGHVVAIEPDGTIVAYLGSPQTLTFLRSSAKPFQALPLLVSGAADHFGFTDREVALACASCALPVGAACGIPPRAATLIWLVMTLGYWAATAAVRGTIAVQRRESHAVLRFSGAVLAIAAPPTVLMAGQALVLRPLIWTAALPLSILSLALAVAPPHARHLRRVGWGLIAASALSAVLLAVFLRQ